MEWSPIHELKWLGWVFIQERKGKSSWLLFKLSSGEGGRTSSLMLLIHLGSLLFILAVIEGTSGKETGSEDRWQGMIAIGNLFSKQAKISGSE